MTKSKLLQFAEMVRCALRDAAKEGGSATDKGYGMRCAAHRIADELWWQMIAFTDANRKHFADEAEWMDACGFGVMNEELIAEAKYLKEQAEMNG